MKKWQFYSNKIRLIPRRRGGVTPRIFTRHGFSLILVTLMLAGCVRNSQPQPISAAVDSPISRPTPTVAPDVGKEPQVAQVNSPVREGPSTQPVILTVATTATTPITTTVVSTASAPITMTELPSVTAPITRALALTMTAPLSLSADLSTQLGMTVTMRITESATVTIPAGVQVTMSETVVISDAFTSPLPAPSKTVLLPTPTPNPSPTPASTPARSSAPMAMPTSDGVSRTARVPILMYHYLSAPPANADIYRTDLSVTPERFAAHLDAMQAAGYTTIRLYQLLDHLVQGAPLPDNPVVITFDDGYRDNYENAFPLLHERGMTASFFVVTDFTNEERPIYMTWEMLREMANGGMDIESHARNHVSLKNKDVDYLVWQALGSLESIEREIGVRPRFVSYPAGEYDQQTIDLFHSANYWAGLTTVQGATHHSDDLFQMHRVRVRGTTTPEELLRLLELDW